jgi:abortive infection bacteriophage resistance protein
MQRGKEIFSKPALSVKAQVSLLEKRGLVIADKWRVERYLRFIGYYRIAEYCKPYQVPGDAEHNFAEGVSFDDVLDLYVFDKRLRTLAMNQIERIEIALRTVINNHMSLKYGIDWFTDSMHFIRDNDKKKFNHLELMSIIKKETGYYNYKNGPPFCRAFYQKYKDPVLPPNWMVAEILTLGTWSRIYSVLTDFADRKSISDSFSVRHRLFGSWIHAVSFVRNICAHHSVLWNTKFTIKPRFRYEFAGIKRNDLFYAQAVVIQQLIKGFINNPSWKEQLSNLLRTCPLSVEAYMGFPRHWEEDMIWN